MKNTNKKGFTIVELVIVVAVIAILAAVLIPTFSSIIKKANESADIQALNAMNKILAMEEATFTGTMEIMDAYKVFDNNGIKADTYTALYKGRYYFYDVSLERVLYTDENYNVLAPEEHKNVVKNTNWRSLNGTINETKVEPNANGVYAISTPEQLYYVAKNYSGSESITIELASDIDLLGAAVAFENNISSGTLKIVGTKADGSATVIKNFVGYNQYNAVSESADGTIRNYNSGFISSVKGGNVHLENLIFDNCVVEVPDAGNVAIVVGSLSTNSGNTIKNVTVQNSTVSGNRNTGALVGMCYDVAAIQDCVITNVNVFTATGRSGIIAGVCSNSWNSTAVKNMCDEVTVTNSTLKLWEEYKTKQIANVTVSDVKTNNNVDSSKAVTTGVTFILCEKYDTPNQYYMHCDDALTWVGDGSMYGTIKDANGNTISGVSSYLLIK